MSGYITTAKIQEERNSLTERERREKERLLEAELAKHGVTRENFDRAYEELKKEFLERRHGKIAVSK